MSEITHVWVDEAQGFVTISNEHGTARMTMDFYEKAMTHPAIVAGAGMSFSGITTKLLASEPISATPQT